MKILSVTNIFGLSCLTWAVLLTFGCVMEKGRLFVKGKEKAGIGIIIGLYALGIVLTFVL